MKLVIGGYAQGKLNYICKREQLTDYELADATLPETGSEKTVIFYRFHLWVKEQLKEGKDPEPKLLAYMKQQKDLIVISDEIGNGIVPLDPFERMYRDRLGRILTELAGQAEEVIRVLCGLGQKIK